MVLLSVARGCHAATSSARATVLRHTVPVALPSLSQRLHLITAACDVYHMTPDELPPELGPGGEPFWGFVWPGSWGLSLHVLASPDVVRGKKDEGRTVVRWVRSCCPHPITGDEGIDEGKVPLRRHLR